MKKFLIKITRLILLMSLCSCDYSYTPSQNQGFIEDNVRYFLAINQYKDEKLSNLKYYEIFTHKEQVEKHISLIDSTIRSRKGLRTRLILLDLIAENTDTTKINETPQTNSRQKASLRLNSDLAMEYQFLLDIFENLDIALSEYIEVGKTSDTKSWEFTERVSGWKFMYTAHYSTDQIQIKLIETNSDPLDLVRQLLKQ